MLLIFPDFGFDSCSNMQRHHPDLLVEKAANANVTQPAAVKSFTLT